MSSIPSSTQLSPSPSLIHSSKTITPQPHPTQVVVVVDLTTFLTIPDFATYYPGTFPDSFHPIYDTFPDGTLVAPPFRHDLTANNVFLIITGCLFSIFLRNLSKAAVFLWRGKVKNKALLYTLFLSQLLGLTAIIPIIVAQLSRSTNCDVILRIFLVASGVSLSLLITGIFGVKAYRCLDNNRFVSAVLVALRTAGSVVLILDVLHLRTFRSLSGRPSVGLAFVFIILLLTESFFICTCFLYAVRKSHSPVAVQGLISVRLSLDDSDVARNQPQEHRKESTDSVRNRKGWSDVKTHVNQFSTSWRSSPLSREPSFQSTPHDSFQRTHSYSTTDNMETAQSSKHPIPFPSMIHSTPSSSRAWTVKIPTAPQGSDIPEGVAAPSIHSPVSRFTRYIPRMSVFREVIRDELCYTAIATAASVLAMIAGVKRLGGIGSTLWITCDWALISLLVVRSFGHMIRRHEDESLLLHPYARYHDLHTDRTTAELLGDVPVRIPGMLSRARARRSIARRDVENGAPPSELSTCRWFPRSAHSSQGDMHSLAASTSGTSNMFPCTETESFSRTQVSSTVYIEDGLSRTPKPPEEWFHKNLVSAPPPPEPPDEVL